MKKLTTKIYDIRSYHKEDYPRINFNSRVLGNFSKKVLTGKSR